MRGVEAVVYRPMEPARWRRCSVCKQDIVLGQTYWVCSVSTCNRKRTGLVFCSTSCWDAHVPVMRHRESWAVEERAPTQAAGPVPEPVRRPSDPEPAPERAARRILAREPASPDVARAAPSGGGSGRPDAPRDILVVVSKLKQYVRAVSGMNTSDAVAGRLSDHVRALCDEMIAAARASERKTVLERDVPPVRGGGRRG